VISILQNGDFLTLVLTTSDVAAQIDADEDILFDDVNIHVYGADVYYGDGLFVALATQGAATPNCSTATANSILTFRNLHLATLFFKSKLNLTPAVVIASGTITKAG
jgi:hypothetical protein